MLHICCWISFGLKGFKNIKIFGIPLEGLTPPSSLLGGTQPQCFFVIQILSFIKFSYV